MINKDFVVYETNYWKVILSHDQSYIGRCVVLLKRECRDLADINNEEMDNFLEVVRVLEGLLRKTFNATMFNWGCLMNNAYQETVPKPQVHWHFRPRYNHDVEFLGETFKDAAFGHHYLRSKEDKRTIPEESMEKLLILLQSNL